MMAYEGLKNGVHKKTLGLGGDTDLSPTNGPHKQINAWAAPGPSAFDFRSMALLRPRTLMQV